MPSPGWKQTFQSCLALYGHRNWIVVADSAYPAQSSSGIETIISNADQVEVLKYVLTRLSAVKHVKPIVYTDQELNFVKEDDVPGILGYRQRLADLLAHEKPQVLPHEEIIAKLDEASRLFRVLIIKTNMTIPYTSVFLQLDCAYWNADAERKLRSALSTA